MIISRPVQTDEWPTLPSMGAAPVGFQIPSRTSGAALSDAGDVGVAGLAELTAGP